MDNWDWGDKPVGTLGGRPSPDPLPVLPGDVVDVPLPFLSPPLGGRGGREPAGGRMLAAALPPLIWRDAGLGLRLRAMGARVGLLLRFSGEGERRCSGGVGMRGRPTSAGRGDKTCRIEGGCEPSRTSLSLSPPTRTHHHTVLAGVGVTGVLRDTGASSAEGTAGTAGTTGKSTGWPME